MTDTTLVSALLAGAAGLSISFLALGWLRCSAELERALAERNEASEEAARQIALKNRARDQAASALRALFDARNTLAQIRAKDAGTNGSLRHAVRLASSCLDRINGFAPAPSTPTDR